MSSVNKSSTIDDSVIRVESSEGGPPNSCTNTSKVKRSTRIKRRIITSSASNNNNKDDVNDDNEEEEEVPVSVVERKKSKRKRRLGKHRSLPTRRTFNNKKTIGSSSIEINDSSKEKNNSCNTKNDVDVIRSRDYDDTPKKRKRKELFVDNDNHPQSEKEEDESNNSKDDDNNINEKKYTRTTTKDPPPPPNNNHSSVIIEKLRSQHDKFREKTGKTELPFLLPEPSTKRSSNGGGYILNNKNTPPIRSTQNICPTPRNRNWNRVGLKYNCNACNKPMAVLKANNVRACVEAAKNWKLGLLCNCVRVPKRWLKHLSDTQSTNIINFPSTDLLTRLLTDDPATILAFNRRNPNHFGIGGEDDDEDNGEEEHGIKHQPKSNRGNYTCNDCGLPRKGHICKVEQSKVPKKWFVEFTKKHPDLVPLYLKELAEAIEIYEKKAAETAAAAAAMAADDGKIDTSENDNNNDTMQAKEEEDISNNNIQEKEEEQTQTSRGEAAKTKQLKPSHDGGAPRISHALLLKPDAISSSEVIHHKSSCVPSSSSSPQRSEDDEENSNSSGTETEEEEEGSDDENFDCMMNAVHNSIANSSSTTTTANVSTTRPPKDNTTTSISRPPPHYDGSTKVDNNTNEIISNNNPVVPLPVDMLFYENGSLVVTNKTTTTTTTTDDNNNNKSKPSSTSNNQSSQLFRHVIDQYKMQFADGDDEDRMLISTNILQVIKHRAPKTRFLQFQQKQQTSSSSSLWYEMNKKQILESIYNEVLNIVKNDEELRTIHENRTF